MLIQLQKIISWKFLQNIVDDYVLYGLAVYHRPKGIPGRQRDRLADRNKICPGKFVEHEIYVYEYYLF